MHTTYALARIFVDVVNQDNDTAQNYEALIRKFSNKHHHLAVAKFVPNKSKSATEK